MASFGLPDTLLRKSASGAIEEVPRDELLKGKYVILYFSAHWCPPCQKFTPMLANWYLEHAASRKFEVVFVSSDKSAAQFKSYYGESMPWAALPYEKRDLKEILSAKYSVRGIPTAVLLGPDGALLHPQARNKIMADPRAIGFPYRKLTKEESFAKLAALPARTAEGEATTLGASFAKGVRYAALYFSASWCPPCQRFTPKFAVAYERLNKEEKRFEAIYLSADKDEASYTAYRKKMPFLAAEYTGREDIDAIFEGLDREGYPSCVLIDSDFNIVHDDIVSRVSSDPDAFPWPAKPVEDAGTVLETINEVPTVLAFTDKLTDGDVEDKLTEAMNEVGKEYFAGAMEGKAPETKINFGIITEDFEGVDGLRGFLGLSFAPRDRTDGDDHVRVILLNIPAGKKYVFPGKGAPTADDIRGLIALHVVGEGAIGVRVPVPE